MMQDYDPQKEKQFPEKVGIAPTFSGVLKCPLCRNHLDIESLYSGKCIVCDFLLRPKKIQNYEFNLEVVIW